ncbi:ERF superfamily [Chryseobacterium nakagawai]|uniref:ERF superfamily n=1 Tax=Chryseobacterium nakagawai TaxID=1241982 RepID=A0AAD0YIA3_CHRNA|nr:ERF family protein [Chryseobacterium nakagawai]AZA91181.1 hypothetical protein EG343_11335 [Chryseobacterium nakagawai]VEH22746.1 ERF superfamily [Chryseobacterium nakagawai]
MKALYKSLAAFQQEVPVIHKDTQGYGYSYADLPAIFEIINPLLKINGLGFTQPINGKEIKTIIFHTETGESIESTIEIPEGVQLKGMNDYQVLGSAITYLRRYALASILGLVTDKDTDGNGVEKKQNNAVQKPPVNQKPADPKPLNILKVGSKAWNSLTEKVSKGETVTKEELKKYFDIKEVEKDLETLNIF